MTIDALSYDVQVAARAIIEHTILAHPRSAQVEVGASELGTVCTRKLAHKLAHTRPVQAPRAAWRPTVGTAVHTWLEAALTAENARLGWDRWITERRVAIGSIAPERDIAGNCDVFDALTGTVLDWKIPGVTTIKKARAARSPGQQYRIQAHLYGLGFSRSGYNVYTVAIYYLPAAGELGDGYYWSEPYDAEVALRALDRSANLITSSEVMNGWDYLIPLLPVTEDFCNHCPWFEPGATDLRVGCPGVLPPVTTPFGRGRKE